MQYYQFHIGDYTTATVHLSPLEDLAYRRLLDFYYMKEKPIPTDIPWLSRRLRIGSDEIEYVLGEFFTLTEDGWENERCNADIEAFNAYKEKQRANGRKGGRPQKNPNKPTANPSQTQAKPKKSLTSNHKPVTNNHKPKKEYTLQFSELWTAYGMKGSKSVSFKRWESLTEAEKEQAAKAIKPYLLETPEKQYRKDFERYLSQKVFEGVLERDAAGQLNVPTNKQAGEDIFAGINWEQA